MLRDSNGSKGEYQPGKKWLASVVIGRQGIEIHVIPSTRWGTSTVVEKGQLMQKDIRKIKEQTRMVKAVGIKKQGS